MNFNINKNILYHYFREKNYILWNNSERNLEGFTKSKTEFIFIKIKPN